MPGSRPRPPEGYFFEDYVLGDRLAHGAPRTITAGDCALYVALTGSRNPVTCAEPVARAGGTRHVMILKPIDGLIPAPPVDEKAAPATRRKGHP